MVFPVTSVRRLAASVLAVVSYLCVAAPLPAQEPPAHPADRRIDPALVRDGIELAARGVLHEGDRVRGDLRVVLELTRQPGDVTFATSVAADRVADVLAAVIHRQAQFLDALEGALLPAERAGVRILFPLELQYMLVAEVADLATLRALAAAPGVEYVWKDNLNRPMTNEGRLLTGSSTQALAGWTGAGVGVAVIDNAYDLLHPELGGSTTLPNSVVKGGDNIANPGSPIHSQSLADCDHGTAVAAIVRRYAPGCHLYGLDVFPAGSGFTNDSLIASAINWCVLNKNGVGGGAPIRLVNMSLGGGQYSSPVTSGVVHSAIASALANDILCVASAGNDAFGSSLSSPAACANCISVGSTWDHNGSAFANFGNCSDASQTVDERICYSNTASFLSIYAPSEWVTSAQCGGGTGGFGGTSAAAPAAAGLIAQLLHARPGYVGNLPQLVSLLQSTGATVVGDGSKRRINLTAAIAVPLTWSAFGAGANDTVQTVRGLANGDVVAGGSFTAVDGVAANRIARWNGAAWSPLAGGTNAAVQALAELPNGDVVAGGTFTVAGAVSAMRVARWDGSAWSALGGGTNNSVWSLAVAPNGDLFAGGAFTVAGGQGASGVARWDGTTWSGAGTGIVGVVYALAVLPNGDLVAGGSFTAAGGVPANRIARWDGSSWAPFGTGMNGLVYALAVLPDGDVVAGGNFTTAGGVAVNRIARWDGSAWAALGTGMDGEVGALVVAPNGDLVAGGSFTTAGGVVANRVARWNGSAWSALGSGMDQTIEGLTMRRNGDVVAGGQFTFAAGVAAARVARRPATVPAVANPYGNACASSGGPNTLVADTLPWLGATLRTSGTGLPGLAFVVVVTGTQAFPQGLIPLSIVLGPSFPGCDLLVNPNLLTDILVTVTGTVEWQIAVPVTPALAGAAFFQQMLPLEVDLQGNSLGNTVTNGLQLVVGSIF